MKKVIIDSQTLQEVAQFNYMSRDIPYEKDKVILNKTKKYFECYWALCDKL